MRYDLKDTINAALMTHTPVVIVEGYDDVKFYSNIVSKGDINVEVKAVETIDNYGEGCEQVIRSIDEASQLIQNDPRLKKYVAGIIDRDVRQYRGTLPQYDNLIVLRYYSYETHLITNETISKLIEYMTKAPANIITENTLDYLINDFKLTKLNRLYYFSLEALKASCDPSYEGTITYDKDPGALTGSGGEYFASLIMANKETLDQFAIDKNVSLADIKYIAKGKWYLRFWCDYLEHSSKKFHNLCGNELPQCTFCSSGITEKCSWRVNNQIRSINMEELLTTKSFIDYNEVTYIVDALKQMLNC